jgi:hypothetical protein
VRGMRERAGRDCGRRIYVHRRGAGSSKTAARKKEKEAPCAWRVPASLIPQACSWQRRLAGFPSEPAKWKS